MSEAFGEAAIENPGSDAQVGAALLALGAHLPRTPTGRPSVAEGVLDPAHPPRGPGGELARLVLAYRKHETAIGLFLEPYELLVQRGDGRARPTVYTLGADTGRMSCVRPQPAAGPPRGRLPRLHHRRPRAAARLGRLRRRRAARGGRALG
jgi:hypothetical protein